MNRGQERNDQENIDADKRTFEEIQKVRNSFANVVRLRKKSKNQLTYIPSKSARTSKLQN